MLIFSLLITIVLSAPGVTITEPVDGESYNGDWLTVRAIVENENEIPDSVHYSLNGEPVIQIPRLHTDWPTYMQNDIRNGFSESPGPTDSNILWTAPVTGDYHIFHSAVVTEGVVYFCHDSLYALDAATGVTIWSYPVQMGDDSPSIYEDKLFLANSDSVFCFDLSSRELVWSNGLVNTDGGSPVVCDGKVFCGKNPTGMQGSVTKCLNAENGALIWSTSLSGAQASCASIWASLLIVPTHAALYGIDIETGDIVWSILTLEGFHDTSPCIVEGTIYIGAEDGVFRAIDAGTGDIIWSTPISPVSGLEATPAYRDGIVVCGNRETIFAVEAENGAVLWQNDKGLHGSPTIADGIVYWGGWGDYTDPDSIYAADITSGETIWSYKPDSLAWPLCSTPPIVDGVLYFPTSDGNLYAFGTGLKFTYLDDLFAQVGANELIVTSFYEGAVASDTIGFTVSGTGLDLEPSPVFNLTVNPNPFSSNTTISFELPEPGFTSVIIYDLYGRQVLSLVKSELNKGTQSVHWNGHNKNGEDVSAGLYLCRIVSGGIDETIGLCLLR